MEMNKTVGLHRETVFTDLGLDRFYINNQQLLPNGEM